jgi:hypothetical protein
MAAFPTKVKPNGADFRRSNSPMAVFNFGEEDETNGSRGDQQPEEEVLWKRCVFI